MNVSKKRGRSRTPRPAKRQAAGRQVPAVLRLKAPERKVIDTPAASDLFSTTGVFRLLNAVAAGAGVNQRTGRKISLSSVAIRGTIIFADSGGSASNDYLRFILFYDRQPNGAAPAVADVLQDIDVAGGTTSTSYSALNINNADRFKVLVDEYWGVPKPATITTFGLSTGIQQECKPASFKRFIKLRGLETHFNAGTANTIADITTGSLYVMLLGNAASANAQYYCKWSSRIRYTDQ